MKLQAVHLGPELELAGREWPLAVLAAEIGRIEQAAALLRQVKAGGGARLTTSQDAAYFALRARLGPYAPASIRDLHPDWYDVLSACLSHDRAAIAAEWAALNPGADWSPGRGCFPRLVEDLSLAAEQVSQDEAAGSSSETDLSAHPESASDQSPPAVPSRSFTDRLAGALPPGWSLPRAVLRPVPETPPGPDRVAVLAFETMRPGNPQLLVVFRAGATAGLIELSFRSGLPESRKLARNAGDAARSLLLARPSGEGATRSGLGLAALVASMVRREAMRGHFDQGHRGFGEAGTPQVRCLGDLAVWLPRLHSQSQASRDSLALGLPGLVQSAPWPEVKEYVLPIAAAVLNTQPGDAVYRGVHDRSPHGPSRPDLEFLLHAADVLRIQDNPPACFLRPARAVLALVGSRGIAPETAVALRRWLSPDAVDWTGGDLAPLMAACEAGERDGRLLEALDQVAEAAALLIDRAVDLEPFLERVANMVERHWSRLSPMAARAAGDLDLAAGFARLARRAGPNAWSPGPFDDPWPGLDLGAADGSWPEFPPSFGAVVRAWLHREHAPAVHRAFLVDTIVLTLERQAANRAHGRLDQAAAWLVRKGADAATYQAAARQRVARLAEESSAEVETLTGSLQELAAIGPARETAGDLARLAAAAALRPRVAALAPGWDLAAGWDEIAVAACTSPGASWRAGLARWLMTGLLRGQADEVPRWAAELDRCTLEDLDEPAWNEVLDGFEARVASGQSVEVRTGAGLEALAALARWLEHHRLPTAEFHLARREFERAAERRTDLDLAWLAAAASLRRGTRARRWPEAMSLAPERAQPCSPSGRAGVRAWAASVMVVAACIANLWYVFRPQPTALATIAIAETVPPPPSAALRPPADPFSEAKLGANLDAGPPGLYRLSLRSDRGSLAIDLVTCGRRNSTLPGVIHIASTEITRSQYEFVMEKPAPAVEHADGPDFPVTDVSWTEARAYCLRIQSALALQAREVRLPLESEWKALAGAAPTGPPGEVAWYGEASARAPREVKTTRLSHPSRIYDLWGNVREWLWGPYRDSGIEKVEEAFILRVARGGSRAEPLEALDKERPFQADYRDPMLGFRIVIVPVDGG